MVTKQLELLQPKLVEKHKLRKGTALISIIGLGGGTCLPYKTVLSHLSGPSWETVLSLSQQVQKVMSVGCDR